MLDFLPLCRPVSWKGGWGHQKQEHERENRHRQPSAAAKTKGIVLLQGHSTQVFGYVFNFFFFSKIMLVMK